MNVVIEAELRVILMRMGRVVCIADVMKLTERLQANCSVFKQ